MHLSMKIPIDEILKDEDVQRTICLIVQAELEEANKCVSEKIDRLRLAEEENFFLRNKIVELERENLKKSVQLRELGRELQNERARGGHQKTDPTSVGEATSVKRVLEFNSIKTTSTTLPVDASSIATSSQAPGDGTVTDVQLHAQDKTKSGWSCVCGLEFTAKMNLDMHTKYFKAGYNFSCSRCPTRFVHATDMRKHLKTVHKIQPEPWMRYGCRLCGCFFWRITELLAHRKVLHSKSSSTLPRRRRSPKKKGMKSDDISKSNRTGVKVMRHGFAGVVKSTGNSELRTSVKTKCRKIPKKSSGRFLCHCDKDFYAMKELQRHVRKMALKSIPLKAHT